MMYDTRSSLPLPNVEELKARTPRPCAGLRPNLTSRAENAVGVRTRRR